jgi:excisionase family DNA binding protein
METYLTIEGLAGHLKLSEQTIRRYVLNREIPYHKIKKVIRFRLSEIERWIDRDGGKGPDYPVNDREGDLFTETEIAEAGESLETAGAGGNKTGEDKEASETAGGAA